MPLMNQKKNLTHNFSNDEFIIIKGAKTHNLKNIDVSIPRDKLTVITGVSGSGKSTLAFDTIYAEGQRRYVESLSTYARQFLEILDKPDFESIDGLSPTISIQQKTTSHNPRSTVGTVTEIYDYLRLLFAKIAIAYCYECNQKIESQTPEQIVEKIYSLDEGSKLNILSPIVQNRKGEYQKELFELRQKGFTKVRIDNEVLDLADNISLDKQKKHTIEVYVDRIVLRKGQKDPVYGFDPLKTRLIESVESALKLSDGLVKISFEGKDPSFDILFSQKYACPSCGISYPTPEPRTFSFNSPIGACSQCDGLGFKNSELLNLEDDITSQKNLEPCPSCDGKRLKKESLYFKINNKNIFDLGELSISDLKNFFENLNLTSREQLIASRIVKEIVDRLSFLIDVGVSYLTLNRPALTLSGGESQRIRLAAQLGSSLTGITYILDEPSIGLHQKDNLKLIETLIKLKNMGNTVIVVEHDEDTMKNADYIIDLGPNAGTQGGYVVATGTYNEILQSKVSLTAQYLSKKLKIEVPKNRRKQDPNKKIILHDVYTNNLKNITVEFPLKNLIFVTGVSGSGKSSLIMDTLYPALLSKLNKEKIQNLKIKSITGYENIDKVIIIDQSPIGRTPRSNPATYTGVFTLIRDLFANLPDSKIRGFTASRFSFNVKGGRCEQCEGSGYIKEEMNFLSDVYVTCPQCNGKRFNEDTLTIKYKNHSINDVLNLTIDSAANLFSAFPSLNQKLKLLSEVGLHYLTLGQSATTLSGGEAQRLKLATHLSKKSTGNTLYILDEPSTGLHFDDIKKLLLVLNKLVDQGNTVVVIEHNLEMIKCADYIIDIGPEAGNLGGEVLVKGTPEEIIKCKKSYTAQYLKNYLL
jgi:excinuclease ABC subunit A